MSQVTWSDDRVTTLSTLWLDGLSAGQIAKQLGGVTRKAVIGKLHRLALGGRAAPSTPKVTPHRPRLQKPRALRKTRPAALSPSTLEVAVVEGPGLIETLVHLSAHTCKWPIGDPKSATFSFCGRAAQGRYCDHHERLGVRARARWRADSDPVVRRALAGAC